MVRLNITRPFSIAEEFNQITAPRKRSQFIAALDPVIGHEVAKTRPVIIVSNNIGNKYSGTVTIMGDVSKEGVS
ncbi:MAG: type II toxin-antitoxin system PemK/MazF family toxin [Desulfotignum sp.]|nr:type II toxin-antitoxin system PemK/MazF family toxin [Desulfotignum sp.]MCF8139027.1 type II toxin-antitoxin system PemK/MazF family toxin [Desulfotignum sp.]